MAGSIGRSISIGLSANTKNFAKSLKNSEKNLERFKNGVKAVGTAVAASFAAMGAAALLFGKSAIDAALEDQKAMKQLAKVVQNNTKVDAKYQHTVEKTIDKLQNWYNVSDDKLRPAMAKLVLATGSVSKSQKLMRTTLDVTAVTGKDMTMVAAALGRAYNGNYGSLRKLALGFTDAELKGTTFDKLLKRINEKVGGAAATAANTYAGKVEGLKIQWQEFLESVGYKLLPYVSKTLDFIKQDLIPFVDLIKQGFQGTWKDNVTPKVRSMARAMGIDPEKPAAVTLGESLKKMADGFGSLMGELTAKGPSGASALDQMATSLTAIADAITKVTKSLSDMVNMSGWDRAKWFLKNVVKFTPLVTWGRLGTGAILKARSAITGGSAGGGVIQGRSTRLVGERGPELFTPSGSGTITPNHRMNGGGGTTIININGVVDAESARRSIERIMQNSSLRTGPVRLQGSIF